MINRLLTGILAGVAGLWVFTLPGISPNPAETYPSPTDYVQVPSPTPLPSGPCVRLPVLYYHHISKLNNHPGLTVTTSIFASQMDYLATKKYTPISPSSLINYFDANTPLPQKPILLTFDDGYQDFITDAFPILKNHGFSATLFLPTGLVNNPDYLTTSDVASLRSYPALTIANHTWSHHNLGPTTPKEVMSTEITTATDQLTSLGIPPSFTFAYPYGTHPPLAQAVVSSLGFKLAFTTSPGFTQCKGARFALPRTRIGNYSLSVYGL